ncbi:hypothetical protein ACE6H2_017146 [Prunus campanulata]
MAEGMLLSPPRPPDYPDSSGNSDGGESDNHPVQRNCNHNIFQAQEAERLLTSEEVSNLNLHSFNR